jgi:hypothetical protein
MPNRRDAIHRVWYRVAYATCRRRDESRLYVAQCGKWKLCTPQNGQPK